MLSSEMLHCVALVRIDVSDDRVASIIRVRRLIELGTLAVTSNRSMLRRNTMVLPVVVVKALCYKPEGSEFETR
jgi:hypothetical protein